MTQDEFFRAIAEQADVTFSDIELVMGAFLDVVNKCVQERKSFSIQNFGVLSFSKVKERTVHSKLLGDNVFPQTERVFFHLSKNLKTLFKNTKKQEGAT